MIAVIDGEAQSKIKEGQKRLANVIIHIAKPSEDARAINPSEKEGFLAIVNNADLFTAKDLEPYKKSVLQVLAIEIPDFRELVSQNIENTKTSLAELFMIFIGRAV